MSFMLVRWVFLSMLKICLSVDPQIIKAIVSITFIYLIRPFIITHNYNSNSVIKIDSLLNYECIINIRYLVRDFTLVQVIF